jgi:hypothetical protein
MLVVVVVDGELSARSEESHEASHARRLLRPGKWVHPYPIRTVVNVPL